MHNRGTILGTFKIILDDLRGNMILYFSVFIRITIVSKINCI